MRRLGLVLSILMLAGLAACGTDSGDSNTVATPPDDYGTNPTADASGAEPAINDHGTATVANDPIEFELEMDNEEDFYFEPTFVKLPGSVTATVNLHNAGDIQHTFTIDDLEVDEELAPDEEKTVTVDVGDATRYEFYCRFHASQGMRGSLQPH